MRDSLFRKQESISKGMWIEGGINHSRKLTLVDGTYEIEEERSVLRGLHHSARLQPRQRYYWHARICGSERSWGRRLFGVYARVLLGFASGKSDLLRIRASFVLFISAVFKKGFHPSFAGPRWVADIITLIGKPQALKFLQFATSHDCSRSRKYQVSSIKIERACLKLT